MAQQLMEEAARHYIDERRKRKIPVTEREFIWVHNEDNGEVMLHVGPTMVSPTAADQVVVDDGKGGFTAGEDSPQPMIEVGDNQYAVLFNPLSESDDGFVNGKFKTGRNEPRPLKNGTRQMIPGPCFFYLRPGQRCEVRDAHELGSNQYLVVKAYGDLDKDAPYYDITLRSAGVTTFTTVGLETPSKDAELGEKVAPRTIRRGQLIVIRGIDTQFFIPPTGVEVVPDTSFNATGAAISGEQARDILNQAMEELEVEDVARGVEVYSSVDCSPVSAVRMFDSAVKTSAPIAAPEAAGRRRKRLHKDAASFSKLVNNLKSDQKLRDEFSRAAKQTRLVREAVVLSEKEFCVIVDADGKRNVKRGPARVFPGPYDTFMVEGSRSRIYDAYELLPQRALWLRVVTKLRKDEFAKHLPPGADGILTKDVYNPGDELLLREVNAFFFPFNEIEVLSPETGQAVVGNDHSSVLIEAIGIDQKSGIYVRDLTTGEAKLIRGLRSYLVDPAKEVHINRIVSEVDWNHWIMAHRPHKRVSGNQTTPWALSIRVPNNTAVMATSAKGQRVIEGPCVELLEYEEKLSYLKLSTNTPKSDDTTLTTCFLRTAGNRVSDVIRVQTSDFVEVDVRVTYQIQFEKAYKEKWFDHENYIQVLVEHLRSLVRNVARGYDLGKLWRNLPSLVRETILGAKDESGNRPGRLFAENGMRVTEVEVLNAVILDKVLANQFSEVQRKLVSLQIGDQEAQATLESTKLRDAVREQEASVSEKAKRREAALTGLVRELAHRAEQDATEKKQLLDVERNRFEWQQAQEAVTSRLAQQLQEDEARKRATIVAAEGDAESMRIRNQEQLAFNEASAKIDTDLIRARAQAAVDENQSIQSGLIEALAGMGDKQFLTEAAKNMNLISLFRGQDVVDILGGVLGGTRVSSTLRFMRDKAKALTSSEE